MGSGSMDSAGRRTSGTAPAPVTVARRSRRSDADRHESRACDRQALAVRRGSQTNRHRPIQRCDSGSRRNAPFRRRAALSRLRAVVGAVDYFSRRPLPAFGSCQVSRTISTMARAGVCREARVTCERWRRCCSAMPEPQLVAQIRQALDRGANILENAVGSRRSLGVGRDRFGAEPQLLSDEFVKIGQAGCARYSTP